MVIRKDSHSGHEQIGGPLWQELKREMNFIRAPRVSQKGTACGSTERDRLLGVRMNALSSMKKACQLAGRGMLSPGQGESRAM